MPQFPDVWVVGMHFRGPDAKQIAAELQPGTVLRLEREPENEYDANAIKVMFEAMHIGYIEAGQAVWIADRIDTEGPYEGVVDRHEQKGRNSHPVLTVQPAESAPA